MLDDSLTEYLVSLEMLKRDASLAKKEAVVSPETGTTAKPVPPFDFFPAILKVQLYYLLSVL